MEEADSDPVALRVRTIRKMEVEEERMERDVRAVSLTGVNQRLRSGSGAGTGAVAIGDLISPLASGITASKPETGACCLS